MRGIICVDLNDNAVEQLKSLTGGVVVEVSRSVASQRRFIYLADLLRKIIRLSTDKVVIVRTSWITELANNEDFFAASRAVDRICLRFCAVHIVSPEIMQKAILKMGTLQIPREDVFQVGEPRVFERAIETMRRLITQQPAVAHDPHMMNLSGHFRAKTLMVGERVNHYMGWEHWPFFDDRDCAAYMSESLEKASIPECDLMWSNTFTQTDVGDQLYQFCVLKPSLNVVAMGNVAHEALVKLNIVHRRVSHPQYVRRFKHHVGYEDTLEQAIRS